jgi:DNA-directed RNA polymerase specialized sigma24 family protein
MQNAAAAVRDLGHQEERAASLRDLEETELLRRVIANDATAWDEFIRRYERVMRHQIRRSLSPHRRVVNSSDSMDDIMGEVWIYLLKKDRASLRAYDPAKGMRLASWMGMLATQTAWKHVRKQRSHLAVLPDQDRDEDPGRGARFLACEQAIDGDDDQPRARRKSC